MTKESSTRKTSKGAKKSQKTKKTKKTTKTTKTTMPTEPVTQPSQQKQPEQPVQPTPAVGDAKPTRQQVSKSIGIDLSVPRVRTHLDKLNINKALETVCEELRNAIKEESDGKKVLLSSLSEATQEMVKDAYNKVYIPKLERFNAMKKKLGDSKKPEDRQRFKELGEFTQKTNTLTENLEYTSKMRWRFSNDAAVVLTSALDFIIQNIVRVAMVNACAQGKAIIQVKHAFSEQDESIKTRLLFPSLIDQLKVVRDVRTSCEEKEEDGQDQPEPEEESNVTNFKFYVNMICKTVKSELVKEDEAYGHIRVSKSISKFCSDVVIQLIERLSPLILLYADTSGIKTINEDVIKFVFKFLLMDSGTEREPIEKFMRERLDSYKESRKTR